MPSPAFQRVAQALLAIACIALVVSCGGGGGAGELGSGGTGVGTVSGFGSIIVDGTPFEDSNATVQVENVPDQQDAGEAKLGQRVEVVFETEGVAKTVNIQAEVVGPVSATSGAGLTVLGQTVVVNTTPASGPVTQFALPYTRLADVKASDIVEVHGVPRLQGAGYVIQATRIEKRSALPDYLRVAGVVAGLSSSQGGSLHFALGNLNVDTAGAVVVPASRSLADGVSVVVWAKADSLQTAAGSGPSLTAKLVRIRAHASAAQKGYLGGAVEGLGATTFKLDGVVVNYAGAVVTGGGPLAEGQYVQVRGDFAADGSLTASRVTIRNGVLDAELRGTVIGYDAAAKTFTVRDVPVNAASADPDECPGGLAEGVFVEVKGQLSLTGIVAQTVKCSNDPGGAVIERRGDASNVALPARTFTLTPSSGAPVNVRWTVLTFFRDVTPAALNGQPLRVEGVLAGNGTLVATKIRLDN